jgi:hypothetical protein
VRLPQDVLEREAGPMIASRLHAARVEAIRALRRT